MTAARCCEQIHEKEKARVSAGSLHPLSEEAHVRDVVQVGLAGSPVGGLTSGSGLLQNSTSTWTVNDVCVLILEEQLPSNIPIINIDMSYNIRQPTVYYAEQAVAGSKQGRIGSSEAVGLHYKAVKRPCQVVGWTQALDLAYIQVNATICDSQTICADTQVSLLLFLLYRQHAGKIKSISREELLSFKRIFQTLKVQVVKVD